MRSLLTPTADLSWRTLSSFESDTSTTRERVDSGDFPIHSLALRGDFPIHSLALRGDFPIHSLALRACKKTLCGTGRLPIFSKVNFVRQATADLGSPKKHLFRVETFLLFKWFFFGHNLMQRSRDNLSLNRLGSI